MSDPETRFSGRRVLALGGARAAAIAAAFEGAAVQSAMLSDEAVRPRAGHAPVVTAAALVESRLFRDAHVVVATLDGGHARALLRAFAGADLSREASRPVSVMPGADDCLSVAGADVVLFSSEDEEARYRAIAAKAGFDATNAVVSDARSPRALLDQCEALLRGQDMRGSALPLRPLPPSLPAKPSRADLFSSVASAWRRLGPRT